MGDAKRAPDGHVAPHGRDTRGTGKIAPSRDEPRVMGALEETELLHEVPTERSAVQGGEPTLSNRGNVVG